MGSAIETFPGSGLGHMQSLPASWLISSVVCSTYFMYLVLRLSAGVPPDCGLGPPESGIENTPFLSTN